MGQRKNGCNCDPCRLTKNCKRCVYCRDQKRYGGPRRYKQKCFFRKCTKKFTNRKKYTAERTEALPAEEAEAIIKEMEEQIRRGRLQEAIKSENLDETMEAEDISDDSIEESEEDGEDETNTEGLISESRIKQEQLEIKDNKLQQMYELARKDLGKGTAREYFRKINKKVREKHPCKRLFKSRSYTEEETKQISKILEVVAEKVKTGRYTEAFMASVGPDLGSKIFHQSSQKLINVVMDEDRRNIRAREIYQID